ncbi:MAG: right-handed parallel beta-helix repeat-containing protein [Methanosphaera sp.]|nr:right-handed parallel beta-helix repeat-containing protein [Methanosphaera sp.]
MNPKRIIIFSLILLFALGAVSASDVDDSSDITPQEDSTVSDDAPSSDISTNEVNSNEKIVDEPTRSTSITVDNNNYNNLNTYMTQYDTIIFDDTFSGKTVDITNDVELTATSTASFTNSYFNVLSNNVKINGLKITNNAGTGSAILVENYNNTQIVNNDITVTSTSGEAIAIKLNSTHNNTIDLNEVTLTGKAQYRWEIIHHDAQGDIPAYDDYIFHLYSAGIVVDDSYDVNVTNNKITATATTTDVYGTNEGMNIRNSYSIIANKNNVTTTNGDMGYGITFENVSESTLKFNKIIVSTANYADGIQLVTGRSNVISYNNITSNAHSDSTPSSYETFAYGIYASTNWGASQTQDNTFSYNNITVNATISYGIEGYIIDSNTISYNNITAIGNNTMGIGLYDSNSNTIKNNKIIVTGETKDLNPYAYEQITPETTGIKIMGGSSSTGNLIKTNTITVSDPNTIEPFLFTIIIETSGNTVNSDNTLSAGLRTGAATVSAASGNTVWGIIIP